MKNIFIYSMLAGVTVPALVNAQTKEKAPNILFILADDYGWNDVGCMGSSYYETPNLDNLAAQGLRFTNGYAACQVSSPSRASIMTGKYTPKHGITTWIGEAAGEKWRKSGRHSKMLPAEYRHSLDPGEVTIAEALANNGYATFFAGKWHLGGVGNYPEDNGFQINIGGWDTGKPTGGYFSPYDNPKLTDGPKGENLSMRLANETVSFMAQHKKKHKKQPFFAFLSFYAVHGPIQTSKERWEYFRDKAEKMGIDKEGFENDRLLPVRKNQDNPIYAGLIQQMDDAIGVVLKSLHEMGLDENTIVVFTSDNGGVVSGDNYSSSLKPLRGGKGRQWEGGIRVPVMIQYPGMKNRGQVCDVPVCGIDFYPTLLDYAGINVPAEQDVDGVSLRPVLEKGVSLERPLFWHYPHYGNQGGEPSSIIRKGDWKLIYYHEDKRCELYNLAKDISESGSLNAQFPEKVEELKKELEEWLVSVNAAMPTPDATYDPIKEKEYREKTIKQAFKQQEKIRMEQFSKDWAPNKDWWGSTID